VLDELTRTLIDGFVEGDTGLGGFDTMHDVLRSSSFSKPRRAIAMLFRERERLSELASLVDAEGTIHVHLVMLLVTSQCDSFILEAAQGACRRRRGCRHFNRGMLVQLVVVDL
jgi:hypothetical protein